MKSQMDSNLLTECAEVKARELEQHLCFLQNVGYVAKNLEEYKRVVRDPKFVCKNCGRVAEHSVNLCEPEKP